MAVAIVFISLFIVIFGIFYLFYSTRNKERLALIEKGQDVNIFYGNKAPKERREPSPVWKIVILNFGLILIGVGLGIFIGSFLSQAVGMQEESAFPAAIFTLSGVGLLVGYFITKQIK